MIGIDTKSLNLFIAGGALPPDSPAYVERPADDELFKATLNGQFCYVLADHHMGKSSLMFRTAWRLQQQGVCPVTFDLAGIGPDTPLEQAYLVLVKRLQFTLKLSIGPEAWWTERDSLAPGPRFIDLVHNVVLAEIKEPIVIFIDGVNRATLNFDFFASFSAVIQSITADSTHNRLTFVLLGMATLTDLITRDNRSLFKAGQKIDLTEFSPQEAQTLQAGLLANYPEQGERIFDRILYWTKGHPYLTQKLGLTMTSLSNDRWPDEQIDALVERLFIMGIISEEPNLQFVEDSIKTSPRRRELLTLFRRVHYGKAVSKNGQSFDQDQLKRLGLVQAENGRLQVRNEVYRQVFNPYWIKANTPIRWKRNIAIISTLLVLILAGVVGFFIQQQKQRADQAHIFTEAFRNTTSAEERLFQLAGLFNLSGYEDQARTLFYEELDSEEQLALFDLADPTTVGEYLITVVKGLYVDSTLVNSQQSNELLSAMAQPLNELQYSSFLGAIELELEINQWLKGRNSYHTEGEYQRAVDAYDIAISMNDGNPGTHFDRGLAYAALGKSNQALADFATVLSMDDDNTWQVQIQQALIGDSQLYTALWNDQSGRGDLIALVPTPTNTPTPTLTPTASPIVLPTDTPLPTATPTTPPTATPTATPSPRPTVFAEPTATPTPSLPTGTITLLNPASTADTAHGVVDFEWEWSGNLPPEFGFEVRVWKEGNPPVGAHDSVLDNKEGHVKNIGGNRYRLSTNIKDAAGVQGQSGLHLWTVAVVRISPEYEDLGQQAEPVKFVYSVPGSGGGGGGDGGGSSGGGGGGVGIE